MDADSFRDAVEARTQTELDRLGSSKRLVAVTGADLSTETVLERAAASEAAAAETFDVLAAASDDPAAVETFESFAATEREHYERVTADLDDGDVAAEPGAVHDVLREQTDDVTRAGTVVGRGLVADRTLAQFVGFFVNDADETLADRFRDLRRDTDDDTDEAVALLASVCEGDDDWGRAAEAAEAAVDAAYEEYVAALNELGVDAKSVC
ncbi:rubrerythrin family protein [Halobacterium rubrum]|uniref:rubrerythrin family protein n=1 Tax=Halobacterium TaxID=2239 RepID=UPI001F17AF29|nr:MULTISPECIES: rubrerythrin family protein [Halobacterium]MDH5021508.1 rubrerythrin family protein [Halobacterium rubrum]